MSIAAIALFAAAQVQSCGACHRAESAAHARSAMAHALETARAAGVAAPMLGLVSQLIVGLTRDLAAGTRA